MLAGDRGVAGRATGADETVEVGTFQGAHGLKGEVALRRLADGDDFPYARLRAGDRDLTVAGARRKGALWLLSFAEIGSREEAARLNGLVATVRRSQLPPPAPGTIYLCDLPGMTVERAGGGAVGTVKDVLTLAGRDYLELEGGALLPFQPELLHEVDRDGKRLVMTIPEGLP